MNREEILQKLRENKQELQQKFPLKSIALFGSYARNEQTLESDVDVMVEFSQPVGFEFLDLQEELERILKPLKIDLISKKGIQSHYKPYIETGAIYV